VGIRCLISASTRRRFCAGGEVEQHEIGPLHDRRTRLAAYEAHASTPSLDDRQRVSDLSAANASRDEHHSSLVVSDDGHEISSEVLGTSHPGLGR